MKTIPVFYSPEQTVHENQSFSPSAGKPVHVVRSWLDQGFPISLHNVVPLRASQIALAHDAAFVRAVLKCETANGFGNRSPEVAKAVRYTTGSMVGAALHVFKHGGVAVSPTSGFHHATWNHAGAFCTFNGLMIAVQALRLQGAKKVGILDCDAHFGNGQEDIIKKLGLEDSVRHWTFGGENITKSTAEEWLKEFPKIVSRFQDCDVLLYQAGADPHVNDPLGGTLTSEQMRRRDRIVFEVCKRLEIAVAWNLAGGYQEPLRKVLDIHDSTMAECVCAYLTNREIANEKDRKSDREKGSQKGHDHHSVRARMG